MKQTHTLPRVSKVLTVAALITLAWFVGTAIAQDKKPNILVIWGDDIGWYNVSAYNQA